MMQKIFLKRAQCIVAGLLYLILFSAYGQNKARLGITGGLNAGQVQTSLTLTNLLWRYNAGVAVEQQLTSNVALAGELIYTRQGSRLTATNGYVSDRYITAFDYIGLPVMLRFRPKGERGFFEVGGQAGYLLSANSYHSSDKEKTFTAFQHTNKIDAGLTGGVGYRLGTHLVADLRYYYGMRPLRENYTAADPQTGVPTYFRVEKWYNRVWLVNLTYYF